jgi:hypothetical protein
LGGASIKLYWAVARLEVGVVAGFVDSGGVFDGFWFFWFRLGGSIRRFYLIFALFPNCSLLIDWLSD